MPWEQKGGYGVMCPTPYGLGKGSGSSRNITSRELGRHSIPPGLSPPALCPSSCTELSGAPSWDPPTSQPPHVTLTAVDKHLGNREPESGVWASLFSATATPSWTPKTPKTQESLQGFADSEAGLGHRKVEPESREGPSVPPSTLIQGSCVLGAGD